MKQATITPRPSSGGPLSAVLFVLILAAVLPVPAWGELGCQMTDGIFRTTSEVRGLAIRKSVPCLRHQKEQVREYLRKTIDEKIPAEKLEAEEIIYKALGMIPEDFDYKEGIIKLYLEQLGGYYDPEREHFVMAAWLPDLMQPGIISHELTHALQDQHFHLDGFMDPGAGESDFLIARSALVEGDATAAMIDYSRKLMGMKGIANDRDVSSVMMQSVIGGSLTGSMSSVPESLRMFLLFPYTSGLRFAHFLLRKGGYRAVDRAFKNPPRSTREILHPEEYLSRITEGSELPALELPDSVDGRTRSHTDTLGEFGVSALLTMTEKDKRKIAEASRGLSQDRVALYSERDGRGATVLWHTRWDTLGDLEEFKVQFQLSGVKDAAPVRLSPKRELVYTQPADTDLLITVRMAD